MGNSCSGISKVEPIIRNLTISNNIERSFRHSKHSYRENDKSAKVKFDNNNNIFYSNQNSFNEAEFFETDSMNSDEVDPNFHLRNREIGSKRCNESLRNDVRELNESAEIIENIVKKLLKAKVAIDGCTYDESRQRFHYSVVPYADIFR